MYVIETKLPDGIHWFAGMKIEKRTNVRYNDWTPYFEDAMKLTLEQAEDLNSTVLAESKGSVKFINRTSKGLSARIITMDGYRYMCRPVRVKELQKGDVFIQYGNYFKVSSITNGKINKLQYPSGNTSVESYSIHAKLYVDKVYLKTKML